MGMGAQEWRRGKANYPKVLCLKAPSIAVAVVALLLYSSLLSLLMLHGSDLPLFLFNRNSDDAELGSSAFSGSGRTDRDWCRFGAGGGCGGKKGWRLTASQLRWNRVNREKVTDKDLEELKAASAAFDTSDQRLLQVVKLVNVYLEPWSPTPGIWQGLGSRGGWSVNLTREAATYTNLMTCCMHVRVVDGLAYFRYGRFLLQAYRVNRANDFVTFLQKTLDAFSLKSLRTEFLFNTCDHPLAASAFMFGNTASRANYMVWSNHFAEGHMDLLAPDFLDLDPNYMPSRNGSAQQIAWQDKSTAVVFRGSTTNFNIHSSNWVSSLRLRLHRMSDAFPRLLDARISRWSHVLDFEMRHEMRRAGILAAPPMSFHLKDAFKYELVVDGGLGTTRVCGVMMNDRVMVRQSSPFFQFFDPLFKPGRHFMDVNHNFDNIEETVSYMQWHDGLMEEMAKTAREELGWTCSEEGRMLAFAVLLVKYESVVRDPKVADEVLKPSKMCQWGALKEALQDLPTDTALDCMDKRESPILDLPGCPTICSAFGVHEKNWHWLTFQDVKNARLGTT